jgi:hypothetical protein
MLAVNRWNDLRAGFVSGLTCDSDDYYNSEQNMNAIYLPKYNKENHCILVSLILVLTKKPLVDMEGYTV